jgi:hypothetical protein
MKRKKIPYGTKLSVGLSSRERDLVLNHTFYPGKRLHLALAEGEGIRVDLTRDDIEEIQGYVAAEANQCEGLELRKQLDNVFRKFQELLDAYDDQED